VQENKLLGASLDNKFKPKKKTVKKVVVEYEERPKQELIKSFDFGNPSKVPESTKTILPSTKMLKYDDHNAGSKS
jgi:hypothetical protein